MKGEDKDAIESRIAALEKAAQSLAAAASAGGQSSGDGGAQGGGASGAGKDDVVDAEFTEVKDKK
jgi:molecular chaperone DnaK